MKNQVLFAGGMLAASLTGACGGEALSAPQNEKPILANVYHVEGSDWPIECYGPVTIQKAKPGDILARMILNNTDLVDPAALGRVDVPRKVYEQAVAEINNLESPDAIVAFEKYKFPARCQPQ